MLPAGTGSDCSSSIQFVTFVTLLLFGTIRLLLVGTQEYVTLAVKWPYLDTSHSIVHLDDLVRQYRLLLLDEGVVIGPANHLLPVPDRVLEVCDLLVLGRRSHVSLGARQRHHGPGEKMQGINACMLHVLTT